MNEKSKTIIREEILGLPKEMQEAINSFPWERISKDIGEKYLLNEGEIETFQLETASFLLGLVDEDSYSINIEEEVGVSKEESKKIAEEAFQKIFIPINNLLEKNIKKNLQNNNPNWQQSINFVLSGGDYFTLLENDNEDDKV